MSNQLPARRTEILPAIPPRLEQAGVRMIEHANGYRTIGFPPAAREQFNVIFPAVELSQVNPDFVPIVREVRLTVEADTYTGAAHHRREDCSLNKSGLLKLADAAKIHVDTERIPADRLGPTERLGWKAIAYQRHSDGTVTAMPGSATFDNEAELAEIEAQVAAARVYENGRPSNKARYGSPEARTEETAKRWRQKMKKASELTETLAIERALRALLKVPHVLKQETFEKTWAVVCYAYIPATPEARAEAARAQARLYGVPGGQASLPELGVASPEPLHIDADGVILDDGEVVEETDDAADVDGPEPGVVDEPSSPEEAGAAANPPVASDPADSEPTLDTDPAPTAEPSADAEVAALARQAAQMRPPHGAYQTLTLAAIAGKGPSGRRWLLYGLQKFPESDRDFGRFLWAFARVHLPDLIGEVAA